MIGRIAFGPMPVAMVLGGLAVLVSGCAGIGSGGAAGGGRGGDGSGTAARPSPRIGPDAGLIAEPPPAPPRAVIGATDSPCRLPLRFSIPSGWKPGDLPNDQASRAGFVQACEIDATADVSAAGSGRHGAESGSGSGSGSADDREGALQVWLAATVVRPGSARTTEPPPVRGSAHHPGSSPTPTRGSSPSPTARPSPTASPSPGAAATEAPGRVPVVLLGPTRSRAALEAFVEGGPGTVQSPRYRTFDAAGVTGVGVTYERRLGGPAGAKRPAGHRATLHESAFCLPTAHGFAIVTLSGAGPGDFAAMLPAYVLARTSVKVTG